MVDSDISIYFIYLKLNTDTYLKLYHIIYIIYIIIILLLLFFFAVVQVLLGMILSEICVK